MAAATEATEAHRCTMHEEDTQLPDEDIAMNEIPETQPKDEVHDDEPEDIGEKEAETKSSKIHEGGEAFTNVFRATKRAAYWAEQCSKHLVHVENRMMETEFMGHEVVRQIMGLMATWSPHGEFGWLMRKSQDIAVRTLRQLRRLYKGPEEENFEEKAMNVVRLYIEESFHRTLLCYEKAELRAAMSSMMLTTHSL